MDKFKCDTYSEATRPTKPGDEFRNSVSWKPGQKPVGGFRSMYSFGNGQGTTKPESKRKIVKS